MQDEESVELERLAVYELLGEAKRGKERYNEMGVSGWLKPKVPPTNKNFLHRTLMSTKVNLKESCKKSSSLSQEKHERIHSFRKTGSKTESYKSSRNKERHTTSDKSDRSASDKTGTELLKSQSDKASRETVKKYNDRECDNKSAMMMRRHSHHKERSDDRVRSKDSKHLNKSSKRSARSPSVSPEYRTKKSR